MTRRILFLLAASALGAAAQPVPEQFFGHRMGADKSTLEWAKVVGYFKQLDAASPRVQVVEFGKSTEGRPLIAAYISSPATLGRLEQYRQIQKRLADPRKLSSAETAKLIAEGKTIVLITCSIHATEVASSHAAIEYAHRLATSSDPAVRNILDNTIVILAPSINPDGLEMVTSWYRKTLGTPYEGTSPPELYQKYTGHDNNRDWYIFSQAETRAVVSQLHNRWHPQIVYDLHQMGPTAARIWVPPYMDPIEPNVDPLIIQQANMLGATMAADLTASGRQGVAVNAMYDFWTPARHYQSYHGGIRILTESASVRIATAVNIRADQLSTTSQGYSARERTWNHIEPWTGGPWRLRDIVDDQLVAMQSLLTVAADRRAAFLRNFHAMLARAASRTSPAAFVLPLSQADPGAARHLLETLAFGAVEIERATAEFTAQGKQYPAGSYVVRMTQPFSAFAKTLLEKQNYPDLRLYPGGPPKRPYDVTAHTLPLLMGVEADQVISELAARTEPARTFAFTAPPAAAARLAASDSTSWREVNAAWKSGRAVYRNLTTGEFLIGRAQAGFQALRKPRVGLYRSFVPSMDEGWTRWILEQFNWDYSSVPNARIRQGRLGDSFDVIVFPDQAPQTIHNGYRQGSMPAEYLGGLGPEGAAALKEFAESGGKLVFLNASSEYAIEQLGVAARNILAGVASRDFYCPGSLLNVSIDPASPLALGLPREFSVWMESSPAFEAAGAARGIVTYKSAGVLASGWLLGEKHVAGKSALVDAALGRGRAILFGFRPQYRAQSYLTLKMLFNALAH
ncbi:MAG: peptidase M14 [Candidatus Solibacter sp.]|nr:peptidase M14 [Candidatus Solibacter sp.]